MRVTKRANKLIALFLLFSLIVTCFQGVVAEDLEDSGTSSAEPSSVVTEIEDGDVGSNPEETVDLNVPQDDGTGEETGTGNDGEENPDGEKDPAGEPGEDDPEEDPDKVPGEDPVTSDPDEDKKDEEEKDPADDPDKVPDNPEDKPEEKPEEKPEFMSTL